MRSVERLLAVGGIHALDLAKRCHLTHVEPRSALEDLAWKDALVIHARGEGTAELVCGNQRIRLVSVKPARIDLVLVDDGVKVEQQFTVRAVPRHQDGRELEVGQWTEIRWHSEGSVVPLTDTSAGEFGSCSTCYGIHGFRAAAAGLATITADLSGVTGVLQVTAKP